MPAVFSHCLTSGSNIAFSCILACFFAIPVFCCRGGHLVRVRTCRRGHHNLGYPFPPFNHPPLSVSYSASLCCVRKFKVLKLAFLDSSARWGVVVVVLAVVKVGNGFIIIFSPLFRLSHVARSGALYVVEALADRV
jgi:hypothetical protein